MFDRYRVQNLALRGCLIAALLLAAGAPSQAADEPVSEPVTTEAETEERKAPPPAVPYQAETKADPEPYQPDCDSPKSVDEADLCEQRRMAKAAKEQVYWTERQFWGTGVEIILLIFAVGFAGWAAIAASQAARAAAKTVGAMRRSERAYVKMSHLPSGLDLISQPGFAGFVVEIKNHGRTPATITDVLFQLDWFDDENPAPDRPIYRFDEPRRKVGGFLVSQDFFFHHRILPMPTEGNVEGELWLYGYVDYTDEFGENHRGGYARRYRPNGDNNLIFASKTGWNYDEPRQSHEDERTKKSSD